MPQQAPLPQSDPAPDLRRAGSIAFGAAAVVTIAAWMLSVTVVGGPSVPSVTGNGLALGLGVFVATLGLGMAIAVRERWSASQQHKGRAEELRQEAGPVVDIATASGKSHVRGTVHVIEPTKLERNLKAALVLKHESMAIAQAIPEEERPRGQEDKEQQRVRVVIHELVECGRFAVVDDSGVAVVDEDAFELLPLGYRYLGLKARSVLALKDGDTVEIIGPARREAAPGDVQSLVRSSGYRGAPQVLLFDGTPDERVGIIILRSAGGA